MLVALGLAETILEPIMKTWDIMGLIPIIRGAGGVITDYHGHDPFLGNSIISSANQSIHAAVIQALQ